MSYTRRQVVLAALVANAIRPLRNRVTLVPAFFASWLASELAPHLLALNAADTLAALGRRRVTARGLLLAGLSAAGLTWMTRQAQAVPALIDARFAPLGIAPDMEPKPTVATYARPFTMADPDVRVLRDVPYTEGGKRAMLDIYLPADQPLKNAPVLLQIHGGAWMISKKEEQGLLLMNQLAASGWICVATNYRLAPKHRWPAQIIDVKRAIAWVRENIAEYGGDPDYIVVTGGSAGGHLTALAALTPNRKEWQPGFEDTDTTVAAAVPFYGVFDFMGDDGYHRTMRDTLSRLVFERGATSDDFTTASPVHHVADAAPEFLVIHGTNDTLARVDQAREFVRVLDAALPDHVTYLELPHTQHAFEVFGSIRARHVIRGVRRWLEWHRAQWLAGRSEPDPSDVG